MRRYDLPVRVCALALPLVWLSGCGSSKESSPFAGGGSDSVGQAGSVSIIVTGNGGAASPNGGAGSISPGTLPPGFTAANTFGGFRLGDPITASDSGGATGSAGGTTTDGCGTTILAVIRDFQPDGKNFEANTGDDKNMVKPELGADRKPVFAPSGPTTTVQDTAQFDDWYRNKDGLNKPFKLELWFGPNKGVSSFQSTAFFPLDGQGYGNQGKDDMGTPHNFFFTTEIHTEFKYNGGEKFNFTGDDDVWVFVNNQLALDLGGVHVAEDGSIDMDAQAGKLGLTIGKVYPFDMFQNERHTTQSNFRADTDLEFVDCGTIVPEVPR
jgi:fibro-slime domain-containing protein